MKKVFISSILATFILCGTFTTALGSIRFNSKEDEINFIMQKLELNRLVSVDIDFDDLTKVSHITDKELKEVLSKTNGGKGLLDFSSYFIEAEEEYNVNALLLVSIAALESGWGKFPAGNGTNLTGYAVYNASSTGTTFENGVRENILETAKLLKEDYLNKEGKYFNGDYSIESINKNYCLMQDMKTIDYNWSKKIRSIGNDLIETYKEMYL